MNTVSNERLDELANIIASHGPLAIELARTNAQQHLEIADAIRELKALREQVERQRKALEKLSDERIACGSCVAIAKSALRADPND